jgi:ATP-dependent exoDNAse (exonuclease V) alpha subunit
MAGYPCRVPIPSNQNLMIEINPEFQRALDLLADTSQTVFITGRAGTGKSTLLDLYRSQTRKKMIVLAPTGVAALNVTGQTIHSFFGFEPQIAVSDTRRLAAITTKPELYQRLEMIVIDEVSMVRADLLDCVDSFLKAVRHDLSPFGGVQMVFIGDLYQLPPVVKGLEREALAGKYRTPYFFDAQALAQFEQDLEKVEFVELEKIYRQHDREFIDLLNAVRQRTISPAELARINQRCLPIPAALEELYITLTATNAQADRINQAHLARLPGKKRHYRVKMEGEFGNRDLPTDADLTLKKGARVMLLVNDSQGRWVNGSLGMITRTGKENPTVLLDSGEEVEVSPFQWEMIRSRYDRVSDTIEKEIVGTFIQTPLRLAWAVTIHKSQGKTFPRVILDLGRGAFANGQLYVALSRCTSLEGILLRQPLRLSDVRVDYRVVRFLTSFQCRLADRDQSPEDKLHLIQQALNDQRRIRIVYLKGRNEKSERIIQPLRIAQMIYRGIPFPGLEAYCFSAGDRRTFHLERILSVQWTDESPAGHHLR